MVTEDTDSEPAEDVCRIYRTPVGSPKPPKVPRCRTQVVLPVLERRGKWMTSDVFAITTTCRHRSCCLGILNIWKFSVKLQMISTSCIQKTIRNRSQIFFCGKQFHWRAKAWEHTTLLVLCLQFMVTHFHCPVRNWGQSSPSNYIWRILPYFLYMDMEERKQENISLIDQMSFKRHISQPTPPLGCPLSAPGKPHLSLKTCKKLPPIFTLPFL